MKLIVGLPLAAKQQGREAAWAGLSCMNRAGAGELAGAYIHERARLVFIEASCWLQPASAGSLALRHEEGSAGEGEQQGCRGSALVIAIFRHAAGRPGGNQQ